MKKTTRGGQILIPLRKEDFGQYMQHAIAQMVVCGPYDDGSQMLLSYKERSVFCAANYWGEKRIDYSEIGYTPVFPEYTKEWVISRTVDEMIKGKGDNPEVLRSTLYPAENLERDYREYTSLIERKNARGVSRTEMRIHAGLGELLKHYTPGGHICVMLPHSNDSLVELNPQQSETHLIVTNGGTSYHRTYPDALSFLALSEFIYILATSAGWTLLDAQ